MRVWFDEVVLFFERCMFLVLRTTTRAHHKKSSKHILVRNVTVSVCCFDLSIMQWSGRYDIIF